LDWSSRSRLGVALFELIKRGKDTYAFSVEFAQTLLERCDFVVRVVRSRHSI